MLALLFILISAAAGIICVLTGCVPAWAGIPVFIGAFLAVNLLFVAFLACVSLAVDDSVPVNKINRLCRWGIACVASLICSYAGIRIHVSGREKLPDGPFLLVSNHTSGFDPLSVLASMKEYGIAFISKPENMKIPVGGRLSYGAGFLPIDRENDRNALKSVVTAAGYLKSGLCPIGVYPEGTRRKGGEHLLPFHAGTFKICQRSEVPLVIMATRGTGKVTSNFPWRKTDVYLDILENIPAVKCREMKTRDLAAYSQSLIETSLIENGELSDGGEHNDDD